VFNLGMGEITVILLLALIFLGPGKLPDLAAGLGKIIKEIRKATSDVKNEIALDDSFRKPFEDLRDAVTLHPDELKRRDQLQKAILEAQQRDEEAAKAAAEAGETNEAPDGLSSPVKTLGVSIPYPDAPGAPPKVGGNVGNIGSNGAALPEPNGPNETIVQTAPPRGATLDDVPTPPPVAKPDAPPAKPPGPPPGAVARKPLFSPTPPSPVAAPPVTDAANRTQILEEADLLPAPGGGPPPPPHLPGVPRRPTPPPGIPTLPNAADKKKT
jgi:Sec-independent protein translocase protein TatA